VRQVHLGPDAGESGIGDAGGADDGDKTLHALGPCRALSRNLIRIWIEKAEAGALDQDMASAELLGGYETRIAALERLVGRQALEIEFLKGAQKSAPSPRNAPTSATSGPATYPSSGGAR
jgi:hypothetical protein